MRPTPHTPRILYFIVAALLFAQAALAAHRVDVANHVPGEQCEWCLSAAHLDVVVPSGELIALGGVEVLSARAPLTDVESPFAFPYRSRAPPWFS